MPTRAIVILTVAAALLTVSIPAHAGCGCDKPPPLFSSVRPAFASPGGTVTIFAPEIREGRTYVVQFGEGDSSVEITAAAVVKRDLADGGAKPQLVVAVPSLPLGPTRVRVKLGNDKVLDLKDGEFTMLQAPLALAERDGETVATCYRAAVGADGTVYLPLDISLIAEHMIFAGIGEGYPLLFNAQDVAIYNTQGFLMQLLGPAQAGIYAIDDPEGSPNSLELTYDRHEFLTYRAQHAHVNGYGLDPSDPSWHVDGTYHVDHDHLVLAIQGMVDGHEKAKAGQTPAFTFRVTTALADGPAATATTRTIQWSSCGSGS